MSFHGRSLLRGIYAVLDAGVTSDLVALLRPVLAGGVRVVQYRAKSGVDPKLARELSDAVRLTGGLFIVNDDLEVARSLPDAGFHGGQEDLAAIGADRLRSSLPGRVLGISCGTAEEARAAQSLGADYIGVGPFRGTATKSDAGPAIGEAGLTRVARAVSIPTIAIGGITVSDLRAVRRAGAAMAAVVTEIARAPDPQLATERLVAGWAGAVDRGAGGEGQGGSDGRGGTTT